MLLPTGQMVSEPRQAEQPACLLCEGRARGAGEGSCFNFTVICCLRCREPACHGQLAAPDKRLGKVLRTRGTKLNFHLVIAFPRRHSSCAIVPLCNCGETCTKETCRAHECPAVEPRSLLSRGRVAQCQPLSTALNHTASLTPNPPCGEWQHHQSRSERGWVQGQPPGRRFPGKGCPVLPPRATGPPASRRRAAQASPLPTSAPAPHEAALILTCHLNEKGERVEVQEEEEDVLILFSLPVSPHEISNDSGHEVPFSKILADLRAGSRVGS